MAIAWPALSRDPTRWEWWLQSITQEHRSPLTGAVQTQETPGAHWACRAEYHDLEQADARLMMAFLAQMRGRAGRVLVSNLGRPVPRGVGGGTPLVNGAGQTGATLVLDGAPLSATGWLLPGDFIGVGGLLYMATAQADSNGSGQVSVAVAPPLRASPADNAAVTLTSPTVEMMLATDRQGWAYEPGGMGMHTFILDLQEAF